MRSIRIWINFAGKLLRDDKLCTNLCPAEVQKPKSAEAPGFIKHCLSKEQTEHVYYSIDNNLPVKINPLDKMYKDKNPYQEAITGNVDFRMYKNTPDQLQDWSILTTVMKYHTDGTKQLGNTFVDSSPKIWKLRAFQNLKKLELPKYETSDKRIPEGYAEPFPSVDVTLDEGEVMDDNTDITTTYLSNLRAKDTSHTKEIAIPLDSGCFAKTRLRNGRPVRLLFDTGACRSFMSYSYFMSEASLRDLPKLIPKTKLIEVGNGEKVTCHWAVSIQIVIDGHLFEVITLVMDMLPGVDMIFGLKNCVETEGEFSSRTGKLKVLVRSIPILVDEEITLGPGERKYIKLQIPFHDELSGMGIMKAWNDYHVLTGRIKICRNRTIVSVHNTGKEPRVYNAGEQFGVLDTRSMGYFHISHGNLMKKLDHRYTFKSYLKYEPSKKERQTFNNTAHARDDDHPRSRHGIGRFFRCRTVPETIGDPDQFPWLEKEDPRRSLSDEEILNDKINLSDSSLTDAEKDKLMKLLLKYKAAFSLRDEIGECPNIKADLTILDQSTFFVRPFPIKEEDKEFMDRQMDRLVTLGILTRNSTSHTSPVMIISRKLTSDKRAVVDFRLLNSRMVIRNNPNPLMSDVCNALGRAKIDVLSCVDLKDAYHSIPLNNKSKEYCGIIPYFGAQPMRYEVLPMGIACAPQIWMDYINLVLKDFDNRDKFIAIMDDILIHSEKDQHFSLIQTLLKSMIKNGLKLSPRKCQLFKTDLVYMGNVFTVNNKRLTIAPMKTRTDALQRIPVPKTAKQCKSFCGVVNYMSIFCKDLQKKLAPIHELTKKGMPFHWLPKHQEAFDSIIKDLGSPPVLHLPNANARNILYSDTSREHCGSALYQVQNGKPVIIGYASKTLPTACKNYSVTELEMTGLLCNIALWKHILHRREFDAAVDHTAVVYIMKAKTEPPTQRIMRLLERLSAYSFNLYYVKGKDMHISDYLSRHRINNEDPNDLIPISFRVLLEKLNNKRMRALPFNIATRSKTKASGEKPPEIFGADKEKAIEQGPDKAIKAKISNKSTRREEIRTRDPTPHRPEPPAPLVPPPYIPQAEYRHTPHIETTVIRNHRNNQAEIEVIQDKYRTPTEDDFTDYKSILERLDMEKVHYRNLPTQIDVDKVLDKLKHKHLRDTHLPCTLKDLIAAYQNSPNFKDIYNYLDRGKLPNSPNQSKRIEHESKRFMLIDKLLFRIRCTKGGEYTGVLCIPTSKVDVILKYYHEAVQGGHQGVYKTYLTLRKRFHVDKLAEHIRAYIVGCHTCQQFRGERQKRPLETRINMNVPAMTKISMDIKYMPKGTYNFILVMICKVSNYIVATPLKDTTASSVVKAFTSEYLKHFGSPTTIVCDQDPAFTSSLFSAFAAEYGIEMIYVSPTNHKSLKAEHAIKSVSEILIKHLTGLGKNWHEFLSYAILSYNSFDTPNLQNMSPFELVFGHPAKIVPSLEITPANPVTGCFKDLYKKLRSKLDYMRDNIQQYRNSRTQRTNKDRTPAGFQSGQFVWLWNPAGAILQTGSKKIANNWVGPLVIAKTLSPNLFQLMSLQGDLYPHVVEETRMKAGSIRTQQGNVQFLKDLNAVIHTRPGAMTAG